MTHMIMHIYAPKLSISIFINLTGMAKAPKNIEALTSLLHC